MPTAPQEARLAANKAIVREFLRLIFGTGRTDDARALLAADVIANGADVGGVLGAVTGLSLASEEAEPDTSHSPVQPLFVLAEEDLVVSCVYLPQPQPDDRTAFYDYYYFNTYRIRDGLIAETWPGTNKVSPPRVPQPRHALAGSGAIGAMHTGAADPAVNKRLVTEFYRLVFDAHDAGAIKDLVAADYRQHARYLPPGREGLEELVRGLFPDGPVPAPPEPLRSPVLLIAEGDITVIAGSMPQPDPHDHGRMYPFFVYDAFRIRDGVLAEHWGGVDEAAPPRH